MISKFFTIILPLLGPLVAYMIWLKAIKKTSLKETLPWLRLIIIGAVFASLMIIITDIIFRPDMEKGTYIPPHMENGELIPGYFSDKPPQSELHK